ncbi:hypothetical protein BKA70DRAFT_1102610 [Coprinopsis sp. MPI-PUGE-AT-0042]|nr:hypothetical protein BKA70DRAFT_1102610 [Coprinopsis sp. MPI-PUGE-AT-0042]
MAARKTKLPSSDEESKSSSSSEDEESSEEDEEDETEQEFEVKEEEDDDDWGFGRLRPFGPPELIDLATPPQITVSLPQISQQYHTEAARGEAPPGLVLEALDLFIRPEVHMHHYGRLPFKTKNLRRGFLLRCVEFGISIARQPFTSVSVTYEVARTGKNYVAALSDWCCPLCSYHGAFPSRLPLERHLIVDHRDVLAEWKVQPDNSWTLKITLPDPKTPRRMYPIVKQEPVEPVLHDESMQDDVHPGDRTMFPFVTLSPPSTIERSRTATSATPSRPPTTPRSSATPSTSTLFSGTTPHDEDEDIKPFSAFRSQSTITASSSSRQSLAPSSSSRQSLAASSSRQSLAASSSSGWTSTTIPSSSSSASRSSVATTVTTTTTTTTHITASTSLATPTPIFPDGRDYPPPPPPDDPLGPAARPPYLPAHSDYGGPTVYYSVRPCGETLFDLLGTLPLDDFGLLAWAVLDKEEEIFESDDVKDEHKVMLALWGRWIMLNRTDFITDYPKGVRHFIDQYWKMIHRAAGWDALRYLLLLLLANRYLSAKEVAQSLKYYEEYTGMEHWAPP